eukprot:TRINITY_DN12737_c0_g1_i2.p1 TRINITY_DN12737_c0_g1~~TRINITY_DN12737_c0_g1_i2.p1  ORF type:complete len:677 (+),score=146.33 TRINITY_DN12737_c0_g1_i2:45-2075(+)
MTSAETDELDQTFYEHLYQVEQLYNSFSKQERIRIESWVSKLCELCPLPSWKRNRNRYSRLLLHMVRSQRLDSPFDKRPPSSELKTLPGWMVSGLSETKPKTTEGKLPKPKGTVHLVHNNQPKATISVSGKRTQPESPPLSEQPRFLSESKFISIHQRNLGNRSRRDSVSFEDEQHSQHDSQSPKLIQFFGDVSIKDENVPEAPSYFQADSQTRLFTYTRSPSAVPDSKPQDSGEDEAFVLRHNLRKATERYEDEIQSLQQQLKDLDDSYTKEMAMLKEYYESKIVDIQSESSYGEKTEWIQKQQLQNHLERLTSRINQLEELLNTSQQNESKSKDAQLRQQLEAEKLKSQLALFQTRVQDLEAENKTLREKDSKVQGLASEAQLKLEYDLEQSNQRLKAVESEKEILAAQRRKLQEDLDRISALNSNYALSIVDLSKRMEEMKDDFKKHSDNESTTLLNEIRELKQKLTTKEKEVDILKARSDLEKIEWQSKVQIEQEEHGRTSRLLKDMERSLNQAKKELEGSKQRRDRLELEVQDLATRYTEFDRTSDSPYKSSVNINSSWMKAADKAAQPTSTKEDRVSRNLEEFDFEKTAIHQRRFIEPIPDGRYLGANGNDHRQSTQAQELNYKSFDHFGSSSNRHSFREYSSTQNRVGEVSLDGPKWRPMNMDICYSPF